MPAATVRQHGEKNCYDFAFFNSSSNPFSNIREGES